uniref:Uncharacterized protein n=1 Tax=Tanacetum cinerariifolium TaxID=118510 RepID=A0A699ISZ8_TANCI|nr:hypothetical protein [Tanacetum cinerariifolium]
MSSASSAVTYTSVYIDSEPGRVFWGADGELSDEGSPRVIMYGYDGLPMLPVAPPSPDYIPGPEEPHTPPTPQDEDEHDPMFILPHDPNFVPEPIYPEYIPLEDEHILSAKVHLLLSHQRDDRDDNDGDSSRDDTDDEDKDEENDEDEEEHLAPANSDVERLLAIPTPLPSPLASLSPPSARERLARCTAPAALPSPPLPPPLHMPPPVDRRPTGGQGIDYGFVSTLDTEARRRGIGEVGYGIRDTWIDPTEKVLEIAPMTMGEVNTRVTDLVKLHEHDTHDLYALLEDDQDSMIRISQRVAMDSQRVDLLMEDMIAHQETIQIMEDDAYATHEAWAHSIGLS